MPSKPVIAHELITFALVLLTTIASSHVSGSPLQTTRLIYRRKAKSVDRVSDRSNLFPYIIDSQVLDPGSPLQGTQTATRHRHARERERGPVCAPWVGRCPINKQLLSIAACRVDKRVRGQVTKPGMENSSVAIQRSCHLTPHVSEPIIPHDRTPSAWRIKSRLGPQQPVEINGNNLFV
ncbi:hypothetical protein BaRGS_00007593 [Batillaria attramentaria]|uniref:Secreted protein n=1 Tax=Batillaria attramentaria TaxID=370345 RepID=A0ABD0LQ17_9CAEN